MLQQNFRVNPRIAGMLVGGAQWDNRKVNSISVMFLGYYLDDISRSVRALCKSIFEARRK